MKRRRRIWSGDCEEDFEENVNEVLPVSQREPSFMERIRTQGNYFCPVDLQHASFKYGVTAQLEKVKEKFYTKLLSTIIFAKDLILIVFNINHPLYL